MICVNSVEVCPKSIALKVGEWFYDTCAEVYPTNADCKEVTWHSEDDSIASVNAWSGYIYAEKIGTTKIYATAADGSGCSDYLTVTVSAAVKVVDVTLSKDYLRMERGTSYTFTATVSPSNATNRTLAWQSSDPYVATVENGMVCGLFEGYTIITATATDGSGASGCCEVDVTNDVLVKSVTVEPSSKSLIEGSSCNLTATVCPSNATNQLLLWRSSDSTVASVHPNTGLVIAQKVGTATIYATSTDTTGVFGTCTVTVKAPTMVECIGVCPETLTLNIGETATLSAEAFPSNATNKMIRWTSDDCDIAEVDAVTGCVTAKAVGTTYISANAQDGSGVSACCEVTVTQEHNALKTIKRCYVRLNTSGTTASILEKPNDQGELHDVILEINDTVYLLDKEPFLGDNGGSWYRILYDGMMVYVTADDESFEPVNISAPSAPTGAMIHVKTDGRNLNLRSTPSTNEVPLGEFSNGDTILLTNENRIVITNENSKEELWYAVYGQMNDGTFSYGWCLGEYLENAIILTLQDCYVRSSPNTDNTSNIVKNSNGNMIVLRQARTDIVSVCQLDAIVGENYNSTNGTIRNEWYIIWYNNSVAYVTADSFQPPIWKLLVSETYIPSKASNNCVKFVAEYERFRATPYDDGSGNITIGYGHVIKNGELFTSITEQEALNILANDMGHAENLVTNYLKNFNYSWLQQQYDAFVSLAFNAGNNFKYVVDDIIGGDDPHTAFAKISYSGDKFLLGLWRRRMDEADIFVEGTYIRQDRNLPAG